MRAVPAIAVLVSGLALYVSRGVLDQVLIADRPVRVALLPAWPALGSFLGLAALGLLWLDRRRQPRGTATAVRPPLGPLVLPVLGLGVLLLPYLPFVADPLPMLQIAAGPARGIVWLLVVAMLAWALWQARLIRADWIQQWTVPRAALAIGAATTLISAAAAARFTGTVLFPTGDEPHYLIIAQSLWRDGDLKIENNHARRDYREYFVAAADLDPHFLTRGRDNEIYSVHPVGLPVLIAPIYAAAGYRGVVAALVLAAAAAAALMWRTVAHATSAVGAATFAWAAIALTAPFLFNSFAVYPEIGAALAVVIAFTRTVDGSTTGPWRWLTIGLACATLPWLSTKYAPMSAGLVAVALARILWESPSSRPISPLNPSVLTPVVSVLTPYATSLLLWFSFFYWIWGTPRPQAPYGQLVQTDLSNLVFGAPGLLFDQEYGLLAYAPILLLAATGLGWMWRDGGEPRRRAVEIVGIFAALLGTVGAFRIWWGGSAAPGRPLASGLLLFMLPIAVAFSRAPVGSARRAGQHVLLWLSIGVTGVLALAQDGFLIMNGRDGTSSLLEYVSPRWPAWSAAPSFIHHEAFTALLYSAAWVALAAGARMVLARWRLVRSGAAALAALTVCFATLAVGAIAVPRIPASPAWPGIDLGARARLPLIDEYDAITRPLGVAYTPFRLASAATVASEAALEVRPGTRPEPQPVRVLHNGRFSLPAGHYRLDLEWEGARQGERVGLQIGRTGEEWRSWPVEAHPGQHWTTDFELPVDASFVGLRGTPDLERVIRRIAIVPLAIVDRSQRPRLPTVLGASAAEAGSYFYYDSNALPEAPGFWVRGMRSTHVTIHRATAAGPLTLNINSGLIDNRLHVSMFGWSKTVDLKAKTPDQIEIPADGRSVVSLELSAEREFVPQVLNPESQDPRPLGVWIEVVR